MAISDRWGMGPLNLGWLVDPSDVLSPDDLVRDSTIRFGEIPEDGPVEIVATDQQSDTGRVVSVVSVHGNALMQCHDLAERGNHVASTWPFDAAMPFAEQRWIEPITAIPVLVEPQGIAHVDGLLGVPETAGRIAIIDLATESAWRIASRSRSRSRTGRDASSVSRGFSSESPNDQ